MATSTAISSAVPTGISTVDLADWHAGGARAAALVVCVDAGLQRAGFLLVRGHGVRSGLAGEVRAAARRFFALPADVKACYATKVGGRGWQPAGVEANGYSEGTATPPDMKESYTFGPATGTGDAVVDASWFRPNVWPAEVVELERLATECTDQMQRLADDLLRVCAVALQQPIDTLAAQAGRATWTCNINHYPPLAAIGAPEPGQFRIGPHTDFGVLTVLDREPGAGGLQVFTDELGWQDAPFDPDALTVNIGDLLAHWTGARWTSGRHRVLPPQPDAPEEDLVSLVYFYNLDHDAVLHPLAPPIGRIASGEPIECGAYLRAQLESISVG